MAANRGQTLLALAILLGAAAAVAAYFSITTAARVATTGTAKALQPVVVTTTDLTYGVKLDASQLKVVKYPKDAVPLGAFSTLDSVVGQTTKVFMSQREPVTALKLSSRGGGLSMLIRPTMRAASLEVNQVSGVSGFVLPGDRVDVLVTVEARNASGEATTHTILQNVEVLAAGQKTQQQDNKPITVQAVTLLLQPEGAEQLAHARHEGEITLALRNPEDNESAKIAPISTRNLLGGGAPVAAAAPRRGGARATRPAVSAVAPRPTPMAQRLEDQKFILIRGGKPSQQSLPQDTTGNQ